MKSSPPTVYYNPAGDFPDRSNYFFTVTVTTDFRVPAFTVIFPDFVTVTIFGFSEMRLFLQFFFIKFVTLLLLPKTLSSLLPDLSCIPSVFILY